MIKNLAGESWKSLVFPGWKYLRYFYAVSTRGRIASYKTNINKDGKLLHGSMTTGYRTLYIHREIAKLFLKKNSPLHQYVIHLNHNKLDNDLKNLRWATLEKMIEHQ